MAAPGGSAARSAIWVRLLAALPWVVLYALAAVLGWLAWRVFPYRRHVVRESLTKAFPSLDERGLQKLMRLYYRGYADVLVEIIKAAGLSAEEMRQRVTIRGKESVCEAIAQGTPVLLIAAHQCNWEWMLLSLSIELGHPLDAAYKPLGRPWAEREMLAVRSRFGARLVPAQELLGDIIKRGRLPRAIAMVADQEPKTSEHKHWTRFLNRETAFYMGPEEIARATRFPAFFVGMRRTSRGHYELEIKPIAGRGERLETGVFTERYARLVEEQIHAGPADWPWSHKRWKLRKSVYGKSCKGSGLNDSRPAKPPFTR